MAINGGTPTIQELAVRRKGGQWVTLASNVTPEFRVVSGYRRMDREQMEPLDDLGVKVTPEIIAKYKWEAFWDAPLMVPGTETGGYQGSKPPSESIGGQPGMPRKPEEVNRATAVYQAQGCEVKTNGGGLKLRFPGVQLGVSCGTAAVHGLQGYEPDSTGSDREDGRAVGGLQVRCGPEGASDPEYVGRRMARYRRRLAELRVWAAPSTRLR